ncbi:MAG: helix-turn-helix domain-containing protein [Cyanobacteriota bacterium]|nr:helix-turn-helix domain-containing protein [Cyanobacteriota bacterium]
MQTSSIPAFRQIFRTNNFSQWEAEIKRNLGMHHSHLRATSEAFHASCHGARAGELDMLLLEGRGELELERTQMGGGLLWLPLKGTTEERINGRVVQAQKGQAILMRPLDHLHGSTSFEMAGLSVILPANFFVDARRNHPDSFRKTRWAPEPLLRSDRSSDHGVLALAMQLLNAVARQDPSSPILAAQLLDHLEQSVIASSESATSARPSLGARRRWTLVLEATRWMGAHLTDPYRIGDVAAALGTPKRTIQQAFAEELGRSPLAHAKLLRLHALRRSLQDPDLKNRSIASQMAACGLPASGETALAYRAHFGEQPRQTKNN